MLGYADFLNRLCMYLQIDIEIDPMGKHSLRRTLWFVVTMATIPHHSFGQMSGANGNPHRMQIRCDAGMCKGVLHALCIRGMGLACRLNCDREVWA
ncbi:hypothetical protein AVEN_106948-1 [Araneus ventricosus]|uniref:Uncharacterized protein n=1 Tax=Araneus ventricosus TaxID=182803 RepID=A0A4Y2GIB3_ARAVE|nr:hypothetical protein AVEN_106948-1 [Araneus ventricosus]